MLFKLVNLFTLIFYFNTTYNELNDYFVNVNHNETETDEATVQFYKNNLKKSYDT